MSIYNVNKDICTNKNNNKAVAMNVTIDDMLSDVLEGILPKSEKESHKRLNERNKFIALRYYGLDGKPGLSMQEIGDSFGGLTRESVRQITNRISEKIKTDFKEPGIILQGLNLLMEMTPVVSDKARRELINCGILRIDTCLGPDAIVRLARIMEFDVKFPIICNHNDIEFVATLNQKNLAKEIESFSIRHISHNGAISINSLNKKFKAGSNARKKEFIMDVASNIKGIKWANEKRDLFYFEGRGRNRLLSRLEQMFFVFSEISLKNLHEGIRRNWRKNFSPNKTNLLNPSSMSDVLESSGFYSVDENNVVRQSSEIKNAKKPKPIEVKMVQMIADSESGFVKEKQLEDAFVFENKDKWSFSIALNYSPLMFKDERGKYRNVGDKINTNNILSITMESGAQE